MLNYIAQRVLVRAYVDFELHYVPCANQSAIAGLLRGLQLIMCNRCVHKN